MRIPIRLRSSKSISLFLFSLFALTSCDLYPENGKWAGDLGVTDERSNATYRCPFEVHLTRTSESVSITSVDLYCGSRSVHWSPSAYVRSGTGLFKNGEKVGEIYPDGTVKLEIWDPSFLDHYPNRVSRLEITWSRIGDSLHFSLREHLEGNKRTMEGSLKRKI